MADRRARVLGLAGLVLLLAGACKSGSVSSAVDSPLPPDLPRCEDRYQDGEIIDYSAEGDFGKACEENGQLITPVPVMLDCTDGRRLLANRFAWGYQGDAMTLFDQDVDSYLPPERERNTCLQQPAAPEEE